MTEEGRCLLDLQRVHPRKDYWHFGGHKTKFTSDLRPSDGILEKGPEVSYKADEMQRGREHSSTASRSHKHQMGYNGLGSSSAEKDPGLYLMRSGTDCGNKRQRVDCSVILEMAQKKPSADRGVKYRSPLRLSVLVSVRWFGSSKGTLAATGFGLNTRVFPPGSFQFSFFFLQSMISIPHPTLPPWLF